MTAERIPFRMQMRDAAMQLVTDYRDEIALELQVYRARPRSIHPPTAFIDRVSEAITDNTLLRQRAVSVEMVVLHGVFDSASAVDQADRFLDGFLDYVADRFHAAGPNTLIRSASVDDDPFYTPEWVPPAEQRDYYASRITLEGFAQT